MNSVLGARGAMGYVLGRGAGSAAGNGLLTGLVAYWGLDEASGNALDKHSGGLTATQAASPGADTGKVYGTARTFNGSSQYFYRASETALQTGDIDFALACWIYQTAKPASPMRIVSKRSSSTTNDFDLYWDFSPDSYVLAIGSAAGAAIVAWSTTTPALNTWTLITAWHDAAANLLWIAVNDGTPTSAATGAATPAASAAQFEIGRLNQTASRWWTGRLGPIAFWKNRTLSADDRAALWNGGAGLAYSAFS